MIEECFVCDCCGSLFMPEEGCYIGPKDRSDDSCEDIWSMALGGWENICKECNHE